MEALDLIVDRAQNLVVPIVSSGRTAGRKKFGRSDHSWLALEDFVRYFLNSIAVFSPLSSLSVTKLDLVRPASFVCHRDPALFALPLLCCALAEQTSVAVLDDAGRLAGKISPSALFRCDDAAAAALSAGELTTYLHSGGNSSTTRTLLVRVVDCSLYGMLELLENELASPPFSSSSSSSLSVPSNQEEEEEKKRGYACLAVLKWTVGEGRRQPKGRWRRRRQRGVVEGEEDGRSFYWRGRKEVVEGEVVAAAAVEGEVVVRRPELKEVKAFWS